MKKTLHIQIIVFIFAFTLSSCEDFFEADSDDLLKDSDYIGNVNELYSGYIGIAAKLQAVADHAIFLTELRSDLLEPTENAPQELWDIYNFKDKAGNSFTNPKGYYDVIVNANNYIEKALAYKEANPNAIDDAIFEPMISGAIRFKTWAYLMLGKIYGEAIYFDEPLTEYKDLDDYPTLKLDPLVTQLLILMNQGVDGIDGRKVLDWSSVLFSGSGQGDLTWNMICPSPEPLLMELNLWAGNYQTVVDMAIPFIYDDGSKRYKASNEDYRAEWGQFFYRDPATKTRELINVVPFDYERNQTNRLIDYFSNIPPSKYYLRPTEVAMDRFTNQTRLDGITKGDTYRGREYSFYENEGDWVFRKFSLDRESPELIYKNNVHIVLYRAADVHLFLAEALNQQELFPEAEAFINDGVEAYLSKFAGLERAPLDNEVFNSALVQNWGLRRRVDLKPVLAVTPSSEPEAYMRELDEIILEETMMESAGEARSYFAMIRMATRYGDPSILADRVSAKYPAGQQEQVRLYLMNPFNWFVKYDLSDLGESE